MERSPFMGYKLPDDVGYEVYTTYVSFYRRNKIMGRWDPIGNILKPYDPKPLEWWKEQLDKVLRSHLTFYKVVVD